MQDEQSKVTLRQMLSRFVKFCMWAAASVYCALTIVALEIIKNPEWHAPLMRFLERTWLRFTADRIGSTSPGFVNSILLVVVVFFVGAFLYGLLRGLSAMRDHMVETVLGGIVVFVTSLLLVYGTQFIWEIAKSGYAEHEQLVVIAGAPKPTCPTCPTCTASTCKVTPKKAALEARHLATDIYDFVGKTKRYTPPLIQGGPPDADYLRKSTEAIAIYNLTESIDFYKRFSCPVANVSASAREYGIDDSSLLVHMNDLAQTPLLARQVADDINAIADKLVKIR